MTTQWEMVNMTNEVDPEPVPMIEWNVSFRLKRDCSMHLSRAECEDDSMFDPEHIKSEIRSWLSDIDYDVEQIKIEPVPPRMEIIECPICGNDSRLRDPFTEARLRIAVEKTTPCGQEYIQWYHLGCAQAAHRDDSTTGAP